MHIGFFTELFHPHIGGTEQRVYEIGKRLIRLGHEVHVFTSRYADNLSETSEVNGIQVHRYAYTKNYITPNGRRSLSGTLNYSIKTAIKAYKNELDIYYFNQWPLLHSILSKPLVPNLVFDWCEVWYDEIVVLEKIMKKLANHHVAVSEFTKRRLVNFLSLPEDKVTVIPNGVDYNKFATKTSTPRTPGKLVYVGRLFPHKHLDTTIRAFCKIKKSVPEAELHLIGTGPMLPTVKRLATECSGIHVHGQLPEARVLEILQQSWLFVTSSEREGSGIAALEAMASGLPVVTVNYSDNATSDFVKEGCCLVVDPTSDALASCIVSLSSNEELWKLLSQNASAYAKRNDWGDITHKLVHFLKQTV
jgi:glycosyltransferase involved in cell wall biosynthesis